MEWLLKGKALGRSWNRKISINKIKIYNYGKDYWY